MVAVFGIPPLVKWLGGAILGYGAHKVFPGTEEREESLRNLGEATIGNNAASQMVNAESGAEAGAVAGRLADACSTCEPPPECSGLINDMDNKNRKLKSELNKYDPISDANGGVQYRLPTGQMAYTAPGGHYIEIRNLQRGIKGDMERYNRRRCYNTPGSSDKATIRAAQNSVNQDIRVPPGHIFIPL